MNRFIRIGEHGFVDAARIAYAHPFQDEEGGEIRYRLRFDEDIPPLNLDKEQFVILCAALFEQGQGESEGAQP